jgi:hypothetical protein
MSSTPPKQSLGLSREFLHFLGMFHAAFSSVDLLTDYAIGLFLKIPPEQTHIITAGMMYGPKARLLADLVSRSDHPNKAAILGPLNRLRGSNKRDIIAHGYQWSDEKHVKFVQRIGSGTFTAKEHNFTLTEFVRHVGSFVNDATAFFEALRVDQEEVNSFGAAALSLAKRSKTSPG